MTDQTAASSPAADRFRRDRLVEEAIALEDIDIAAAQELVSEGKAKLDAAGDDDADAEAACRVTPALRAAIAAQLGES